MSADGPAGPTTGRDGTGRDRAGRDGAALVIGAALLALADLVVRLPVNGQELKLGVLTALVGAPFFLWRVIANRGRP